MKKLLLFGITAISLSTLAACGSSDSTDTTASSSKSIPSGMVKVPVYDMSKISADKEVSGNDYLKDLQIKPVSIEKLENAGFKVKVSEMTNSQIKEDAKGTSVDEILYVKGNSWLSSSNPSVKNIDGEDYAKKGSTLTLVVAKEDSDIN